ncbi:MAG: isoprenylcysteine carboxylmethyltransferase family protein [Chloroflexota bacterium]
MSSRIVYGLVTSGIYRQIRHLMYSAIFLIYIAQALLIHNWIAGLGGIVTFGIMYVIRIPHEEEMMGVKFGEAYDAYCQSTGRLFPKLG